MAGFVLDPVDHDGRPESRTVLANAPAFRLEPAFLCGLSQRTLGDIRVAVFGRIELTEVLSDNLLRRVSLDALGTGIPGCDISGGVELEDRIVDHRLDESPVAPFAVKQVFVRLLPFG